jgi:phosphoribosylformylglycinamidine synthase PurS subunit
MKAKVEVVLKSEVLDPQGQAVQHALQSMDFREITSVRIGKLIELEFSDAPKAKVEEILKAACSKLLANTVIEDYRWSIED